MVIHTTRTLLHPRGKEPSRTSILIRMQLTFHRDSTLLLTVPMHRPMYLAMLLLQRLMVGRRTMTGITNLTSTLKTPPSQRKEQQPPRIRRRSLRHRNPKRRPPPARRRPSRLARRKAWWTRPRGWPGRRRRPRAVGRMESW